MKLLDVSLTGFKSFAHKTTFRLSDGLTAVIGPNGSGKSNLAEAIRWVLGEQSLKNLRGKKSDDVIFAGSPAKPATGSASVTLTFSNESGRLPVEAAEVALSRWINRDGESEYAINGEAVRLLDVQQLLAEAGIGAKSYTVISQGTVDRYLQATPAGRRELFDEATGIKPLQLKLQQAERKLHQAEHDAHELTTIQQELTPRLRVLKRQAARDEERQSLAAQYQQKSAAWLHHAWHEAAAALQQTQENVAAEAAAIAQAAEARHVVEQQLLQGLNQAENTTNQPNLQQQLAVAEAELHQRQRAYEHARREREELEHSLATVRQELVHAQAKVADARVAITQNQLWPQQHEVLSRCQVAINQLLAGQTLAHDTLEALQTSVAQALADTTNDQAVIAAAEAMVERLAGPLAAVARLEAITQERFTRLQKLVEPTPPDTHTVVALRQQLKATPPTTENQNDLANALDRVRTEEIAAERRGSAAHAAVEQARTAVAEIERTIVREKGSDFLHEVQTTPPPHNAHVAGQEEIQHLAARLNVLGESDPLALKEYEEVAARSERLEQHLADIQATMAQLHTLKRSLTTTMHGRFREQFAVINQSFRTYFIQLFNGGTAHLEIIDVPDETTATDTPTVALVAGVEIMAHPPGKKPQHIGLLSGGEKTLTSLALLLAILDVQQPPFLVLDEVDAALDEANSYRFASLLREKSTSTQCIVISHNRETMAQADVLYGITMQDDGVSKAYSVKLSEVAIGEAVAA